MAAAVITPEAEKRAPGLSGGLGVGAPQALGDEQRLMVIA
jgi:hypothetical protein